VVDKQRERSRAYSAHREVSEGGRDRRIHQGWLIMEERDNQKGEMRRGDDTY